MTLTVLEMDYFQSYDPASVGDSNGKSLEGDLIEAAFSLGITYEQLTCDLDGSHYSSLQAEEAEVRQRG